MTEPASSPAPLYSAAGVIFAGEVLDDDTSGGTCTLEPGDSGAVGSSDPYSTMGIRGGAEALHGTEAGTGTLALRGPAEYLSLDARYRPPDGLPGSILEAAARFPNTRTAEHRTALARLETGLLHYGFARVRGGSTHLPEKRFGSVLREKLERGEWHELRPLSIYRGNDGLPRTLPRVLALSPRYALELIGQDTGERFDDWLDYVNGRRLPPRKPVVTGMTADLVPYLEAGTGLIPDHATALRLLHDGEKAVGWRRLSLAPPGGAFRPSWCGKDCGRFYAFRPALQGLPKAYRRAALFPAGAGEGFAELDFRSCHPNIARILAGLAPLPDAYTGFMEDFGFPRELVKLMVLPILHGRSRQEHIHRFGNRAAGLYDAILEALHAPGNRLFELESDILRGVLRRMRDAGIPSGLPVHDSILTTEPGTVAGFMEAESARVLGGEPLPVKVTPAGPERLPF